MAVGKKKYDDVAVRDYINLYGGKNYGVKNSDIDWVQDTSEPIGGYVTIGGTKVASPTYGEDGRSYMNESALKDAIDRYAVNQGIKKPYEAMEPPKMQDSPYSGQIDSLLNDIMNTKSFSYDLESDPSFQAYRDVYTKQGDRAFTNAMGEAAGLTGGRLNSWAMTAGSQARDVYNDRLMERVPELERLAYDMYMGNLNQKIQNLNMLQYQDQTAYNRHRDTVGDYQTDRQFEYGVDRDRRTDYQVDRQFNYGVERDKTRDEQWGKEFDYKVTRDKVLDEQWLKEFDANERQRIIENAQRNRQISVTEANYLLNKSESEWSRNPDNPDNRYKEAQIQSMGKKTSYKDDPEFADDIAYVNSNKDEAYNELISNPKEFIDRYGYDGYKELLRVAKPSASATDINKLLNQYGIR